MLLVIQAEAADGLDIFPGKRRKEKAYILMSSARSRRRLSEGSMYGNLLCHIVPSKNVPFDHASLLCLTYIADTLW